MIKLMDANCDGCISWDEFEKFMMNEFAAGQQLLSGEFVLPSGNRGSPLGACCDACMYETAHFAVPAAACRQA